MIAGRHIPHLPAFSSREVLERLVDEGMDVVRFKFSHGTPQSNAEVLATLTQPPPRLIST